MDLIKHLVQPEKYRTKHKSWDKSTKQQNFRNETI